MKKLTGSTKYLAMPSLLAGVVGVSLLGCSSYFSSKKENYIIEASITHPAIRQVDSLENSAENLGHSQKALTYYSRSPPFGLQVKILRDHSPDVDESLKKLSSARENLSYSRKNNEIASLDNQIQTVYEELDKTARNKPESYYLEQIKQIQGLEDKAQEQRDRLKENVPSEIVQQRESLKSQADYSNMIGTGLGLLGLCGIVSYGVIKLFDKTI